MTSMTFRFLPFLSLFIFTLANIQHASGSGLYPLKNLMKDNKSNNNNNDEKNGYYVDASTGTVTALEPGTEKEPVTCNEIMAKAVVLASEEKEAAIQQRNLALAEATVATNRADEISTRIDAALAEAKNATIEYEAMKLYVDRLVDEGKREAGLKIDAVQKETAAALEEAHRDLEEKKTFWEQEAGRAMQDAKAQSQADKEEARDHIEQMRRKAEEEVALVNKEMDAVRDKAKAKIDMVQSKAEQEVALVNKEIDALRDDTKLLIDKVKDEANQETKKIQQEAQEEIFKTYSEAKRTTNEALERSSEIERNAEETTAEVVKRVESEVSDLRRNSQHKIEEIEENCIATINEGKEECSRMIVKQENKVKELELHASNREVALQATIDGQDKTVTSLKLAITNFEHNLDESNNELRYWVQLHDNQGFINATLVKAHSRAVIHKSIILVEEKAKLGYGIVTQQMEFIYKEVDTLSQPHRKKLRTLYEKDLQKTVDSKIIPFYQERIAPLQHKAHKEVLAPIAIKYQEKGRELSNIMRDQAQIKFDRLCLLVQEQALIVKVLLSSDKIQEKVTVPEGVIGMLEDIENDSTTFVSVVLKSVAAFTMYKLRYTILNALFSLCFLPLRLFWYCCPLRLVFRGRKEAVTKKKVPVAVSSKGKKGGSKLVSKKAVKKQRNGHEKKD